MTMILIPPSYCDNVKKKKHTVGHAMGSDEFRLSQHAIQNIKLRNHNAKNNDDEYKHDVGTAGCIML